MMEQATKEAQEKAAEECKRFGLPRAYVGIPSRCGSERRPKPARDRRAAL